MKRGTGDYVTMNHKMRETLPSRRYEHDQSDSPFPASLSPSFKKFFHAYDVINTLIYGKLLSARGEESIPLVSVGIEAIH